MHHLLWPACALALMTAACDNAGTVRITSTSSGKEAGVLKVVDTLQCPQTQGVLTRKGSARADGTTCVYSGPRGSEVTLHLVSLNGGSVQDALKVFEIACPPTCPKPWPKPAPTRIALALKPIGRRPTPPGPRPMPNVRAPMPSAPPPTPLRTPPTSARPECASTPKATRPPSACPA